MEGAANERKVTNACYHHQTTFTLSVVFTFFFTLLGLLKSHQVTINSARA
jgi:hypothetical protein